MKQYRKEIVWVFGYSCVGKKTTMINTALHTNDKILKALELERDTVFIPFIPYEHDRRNKLQKLFDLFFAVPHEENEKLVNTVYLIHGQWQDLDLADKHLEYFYNLYHFAFGTCIWLDTDKETHEIRRALRNVTKRWKEDYTEYEDSLKKYFKTIIKLKI